MKPYALWLYEPATFATQNFQASLTANAKGWRRSTRSNGGFWQGSMSFDGKASDLRWCFENWLGYEVRERSGGVKSWEGLIYEMDLTVNGVTRRRSLDAVANRVKTTYTKIDFTGNNFVDNPGFENYTATGPPIDNMWNWEENNGTNGTVLRSGNFHSGASSVALLGDIDGVTPSNTYIKQHLDVTPGAQYRLIFWTRGDGGVSGPDNCGWWAVDDPTAAGQWVKEPTRTNNTTTTWSSHTLAFTGPGEGEVVIWFYAPLTALRIAYFDDVEILEERPSVYETAWAENTDPTGPIGRYGAQEMIVHLDDYPQPTSTAYRDTYYGEHAWPWPRPVKAGPLGEPRLDVSVCGYIFTANWQYLMMGDGTEQDLDHWITAIVGTLEGRSYRHGGTTVGAGDCQFLSTGAIDANGLHVAEIWGIEERPWDRIQELVSLGDATGNQWHAWVDVGRKFHYRPIVTDPRYYLHRDGIHDTMAGRSPVNPWLMRPAVIRDMTYRTGHTEEGSFLLTDRDFYAEIVEMGDGWSFPSITTAEYSEAELLLRQMERGQGG